MKAYWGSGGIVPGILDVGTRWRWVVSLTSRPFYPQGENAWYPLDRRLGGPQNRSWHGDANQCEFHLQFWHSCFFFGVGDSERFPFEILAFIFSVVPKHQNLIITHCFLKIHSCSNSLA